MTTLIRAVSIFMIATALVGSPIRAEQAGSGAQKTLPPLDLIEPKTTEACLELLESVLEHAEAADLLDDQIDKSEAELERMDIACHDKRFADALDAAKIVAAMISTNK